MPLLIEFAVLADVSSLGRCCLGALPGSAGSGNSKNGSGLFPTGDGWLCQLGHRTPI
jgi:hypothetical protein